MDYNRPKCFIRGGYLLDTLQVVMQFSDYSIYAFSGLTLDDWTTWKDAYPHGSYFNMHYRKTAIIYEELDTYPENLKNELIET